MVDDGSGNKRGPQDSADLDEHGEGDNKGRTVFGIGLPAAVRGTDKTGPAPVVPPQPARAPARPRVAAPAPQPPRPSADGETLEDVRNVARPDHTLHALPHQLLGAVTGRAPAPEPEPPPRRTKTGDYTATTPDVRRAGGPVHVVAEGTPEVERPRVRLLAGKPIPGTRYRLLRWLGEGGMGVVYEAEHIDIERRVALKILRAELSERSDTAQVFREEARAAARAGSKNNVEIFDFGELPDGRLFFCMELLSGTDLATLTEKEIEPPRTIAVLRQICKGLGAAHKAGIVHRDIKPENVILVTHEGRRDMVKIVDFGVAAILDARRDGGGPIAGTPQYMAPEQINGGEFDARLDIYAVGCLAYEMLVHHPPFTQENLADVLLSHLNTPPPPPLTVLPSAEPKSLEAVIMRCLEKDPTKRYANMAELEVAICEAQIAAGIITEWDDLPLPDIDPERRAALLSRMPSAQVIDPNARRRWLWPSVAAVLALAVTGLLLILLRAPEVPPEVMEQIERISQQAREAASKGRYVMAPHSGDSVALLAVRELEGLEGAGEGLADERGGVLRKEFSNQLVTFADKFYQQDATRSLAYEYYDWAMMFDDTNARARELASRSAGERKDLIDRMMAGKLSEGELAAMVVATEMVNPDEQQRKAGMSRLLADNRMPLSKKMALAEAARGAGVDVPADPPPDTKAEPDPPPATTATPEPDPPTPDPPEVEPGKKTPSKPSKKKDGGSDELAEGELESGAAKRDPAKASELAGQGSAALQSGRRSEAEALFNQAISFDRKNAEALAGLSDIWFDRGSSQKAQRFAEQAVSFAPNNGTYRVKLGDAYYAALRYRDALTQYEKAQQLGDPKAAQRIAKVKTKLGE
jgi:serine/threonine protein kinase/tetratricopeptide (TPR) repeat protein